MKWALWNKVNSRLFFQTSVALRMEGYYYFHVCMYVCMNVCRYLKHVANNSSSVVQVCSRLPEFEVVVLMWCGGVDAAEAADHHHNTAVKLKGKRGVQVLQTLDR